MNEATRAAIDDHVCAALSLPVDALRRAEVIPHRSPRDDRAIDIYRLSAACLVLAPNDDLALVRARTAGATPDEVFTRTFAARLADAGATVHGPSWHGYVDAPSFLGRADARVSRIDAGDVRLRALRDRCDVADWGEGGFPIEPATIDPSTTALYGFVDGDDLLAAGNMTPWRGQPGDVGLVTRADRRGEGLGTAVAATMVADWLPVVDVVRYRALTTNAASLAVAARLGFEGYGANILVRRP